MVQSSRWAQVTLSSYDDTGTATGVTHDVNLGFQDSMRPVFGGLTGGFQYGPDPSAGDIFVMSRGPGGTWFNSGFSYLPNPPDNVSVYALGQGESAVIHKSGSVIHLKNDGDVVIIPSPGGHVRLGSIDASLGAAREGDPVSVIINGSTYTGTIQSGSTLVDIG